MLSRIAFASLAAMAVMALPAAAQTTGTTASPTATNAQDFVTQAAMSDMFEIQSGKLAEKKSGAKSTDQLAKHLVQDHTKSTKQLQSLTQKAGISAPMPTKLDDRHQQMLDQLNQANKGDFDKLFAQMQVQAHQEGIALFQSYAQSGDNAQLKQFAQKGLPTLKEHLSMSEKLQTK